MENQNEMKNIWMRKHIQCLNQNCSKTGYGINGRPLVYFKKIKWEEIDLKAGRKVCCFSVKDATDEELCENCADGLEKYLQELASRETEASSGNDKIIGLLQEMHEMIKTQAAQNQQLMEENAKLNKKLDDIIGYLTPQTHF